MSSPLILYLVDHRYVFSLKQLSIQPFWCHTWELPALAGNRFYVWAVGLSHQDTEWMPSWTAYLLFLCTHSPRHSAPIYQGCSSSTASTFGKLKVGGLCIVGELNRYQIEYIFILSLTLLWISKQPKQGNMVSNVVATMSHQFNSEATPGKCDLGSLEIIQQVHVCEKNELLQWCYLSIKYNTM